MSTTTTGITVPTGTVTLAPCTLYWAQCPDCPGACAGHAAQGPLSSAPGTIDDAATDRARDLIAAYWGDRGRMPAPLQRLVDDLARALRSEAACRAALADLHAWASGYVHPKGGMGAGLFFEMWPLLTPAAAKELLRRTVVVTP